MKTDRIIVQESIKKGLLRAKGIRTMGELAHEVKCTEKELWDLLEWGGCSIDTIEKVCAYLDFPFWKCRKNE